MESMPSDTDCYLKCWIPVKITGCYIIGSTHQPDEPEKSRGEMDSVSVPGRAGFLRRQESGEVFGNRSGQMVEEGGVHPGPVAIRGGVPVIEAADQAIVAGEGGDGQGAEEVFHVGRHQTEKGSEISAHEERMRKIRDNFEKRCRGDDIDPIPQDIGFPQELEERLRLRPAKEGEPDEGDAERLFAPPKQPLEELPDSLTAPGSTFRTSPLCRVTGFVLSPAGSTQNTPLITWVSGRPRGERGDGIVYASCACLPQSCCSVRDGEKTIPDGRQFPLAMDGPAHGAWQYKR